MGLRMGRRIGPYNCCRRMTAMLEKLKLCRYISAGVCLGFIDRWKDEN